MDVEIKVGQVWSNKRGHKFVVTEVTEDKVKFRNENDFKFIHSRVTFPTILTFYSDRVYKYSVGDEVSVSYKGKQCNGVVCSVGNDRIFVEFHYGNDESVLGLPFAEVDVHPYHHEYPEIDRIEVDLEYKALKDFEIVPIDTPSFLVWEGQLLTVVDSWYCDTIKVRVYRIFCGSGGHIDVTEDILRRAGWAVNVEFVEDATEPSEPSEPVSVVSEEKMFRALEHLDMSWVTVEDLERIIKLAKEL